MVKGKVSTLFNADTFNKEETRLLNKINKCKTRKCAKLNKEQRKERIKFEKEQDKKCTQKSSQAFYDCSVDFYNKSKYKNLFYKYVECGNKKCSKENRTLKKLREKDKMSTVLRELLGSV
jgi:hypothetical protein